MCNIAVVQVVIIQIWPISTIQVKRPKTGWKLCSYHNEDRKVPGKHGGIKSSVFIGYDEELKLHLQVLWKFSFFTENKKTEERIFGNVYWILKMYPSFVRRLIVIGIMLICLLFVWINMLRTYLKLNFVFGANRNEYKGRCVFVYLQEGKNHEKQLRQGVLNNSEKQLQSAAANSNQ